MELQQDFFVGVVEENKDPNRKGRIKVRVQTLYNEIDIEDIPYAHPLASLAGKEFQVPAIGKLVNIYFFSNDLYSPYYIYSENYNENLRKKLKSIKDDDVYTNFTAMLFDEKTQIYMEKNELTIDQLLNKMTINNTSINHELKDNTQRLNLGTKNSTQDAVLGTRYFEWMDRFMNELANPFSLMGNRGSPILRPMLNKLIIEYKLLRPDFVSKHVKIVDNGAVKKLKRTPDTVSNKEDIDLILDIVKDESCDSGSGNESETENKNIKDLKDKVKDQNKKACKTLSKGATTNIVPLNKESNRSTWEHDVRLSDTDNDELAIKISELHPDIIPHVISFFRKCLSKDIKMKMTDGYRSIATQQSYVDRGLPAAKPGFSYHNYGLAIDVSPTNSNDWTTIGNIGESLGFRWGKHFKNPKSEPWHFDWGKIAPSTSELKKRLDNNDVIAGYVRIKSEETIEGNEYKGSEYKVEGITDICIGEEDFNSKNEEDLIANNSDENEEGTAELDEDPSKEDAEKSDCTDTKYPELPIIDKPPATELRYDDAIKYLEANYGEATAKSVFAVMYAESSKNNTKTAFKSLGGYNYSGVQTDSGKWGYSNFTAQYATQDAERCRMFAAFNSNNDFLDFMANRLQTKGFGVDDGKDAWTERYLNNWVFLNIEKRDPSKYEQLFTQKARIYTSAMNKYNNLA